MKWGLDVLAADPVPQHREWVPVMRGKYGRRAFETEVDALSLADAMKRGNSSLQIRIVPIEEEA